MPTTSSLYRLAGIAGLITGTLVLVSVARRNGVIPDVAATRALAPPASALALLTLTALYLRQRTVAGRLGLVGYVVNFLGLAGLFAIEFMTQLVLPYLSQQTRTDLLASPARTAFLTVAFVFLAGVLLFGAASLRARVFPPVAIALYLVGFAAAALRTAVPEVIYSGGLFIGGIGVLWLATALVRTPDAVVAGEDLVRQVDQRTA
jgi:hypothetical protein